MGLFDFFKKNPIVQFLQNAPKAPFSGPLDFVNKTAIQPVVNIGEFLKNQSQNQNSIPTQLKPIVPFNNVGLPVIRQNLKQGVGSFLNDAVHLADVKPNPAMVFPVEKNNPALQHLMATEAPKSSFLDSLNPFLIGKSPQTYERATAMSATTLPFEKQTPESQKASFGYMTNMLLGATSAPEEAAAKAAQGAVSKAAKNFDLEKTLEKFGISSDTEKVLRDTVQRTPYEKSTITWDETKKAAQELGINPGDILRKKAEQLTRAELLSIKNIVNDNANFIAKGYQELQSSTITKEGKNLISQKLDAASKMNDELLNKFLAGSSEAGRVLNSLKIIANRSMEPATWYGVAKRMMGAEDLTSEVQNGINQFIAKSDRIGLVDYISKLQKTSLAEKATTLWKAGLLTSPTTHVANAVGNASMAAMEMAKNIPATLIDWAISPITGTRTKTLAFGKVKAGLEGAAEGAKKASTFLKTGIDVDNILERYDIPKVVNFGDGFVGQILNGYTQSVFRSLGAADKVFRQRALKESLFEQAYVSAKNAGLKGGQFKNAVQSTYANPTLEMAKQAIDDAEYAVFQGENILNTMASGAKRIAAKGGPIASTITDVLMPFVRTPTNVAKTIADYSPLGLISTLLKQIKPADRSQKALVEGLGRAVTGSGVIALGSLLASQGLMTGTKPKDASEAELQRIQGMEPSAVKIGNTWVQVSRISPVGNLLALGADIYSQKQNGANGIDLVAGGTAAGIKGLTEQTFLKGVNNAMDAIDQPDRKAKYFIQSLVGSVIPSLVGKTAQAIDPRAKDPQNVLQALEARVPFLSKNVPARQGIFGRDQVYQGGIANLVNPFYYSTQSSDPVVNELGKIDAAKSVFDKKELEIKGLKNPIPLNDEQQRYFTAQAGQWYYTYLKKVMESPQWQTLSTDQKKSVVDSAYSQASEQAKKALVYKVFVLEKQQLPQ